MKPLAVHLSALCICCVSIYAQSPARSLAPSSDSARLEVLAQKIDEQNAKIDLLSQQILKLEQQLSNSRSGVASSESTPAAPITTSTSAPVAPVAPLHHATPAPAAAMGGNTHTVERGETLTSIAKMYNVSVSELQKYNHIENDRKLQIGQTIMIPGAGVASPAPSASTPE
jgi:LysM repeat protein